MTVRAITGAAKPGAAPPRPATPGQSIALAIASYSPEHVAGLIDQAIALDQQIRLYDRHTLDRARDYGKILSDLQCWVMFNAEAWPHGWTSFREQHFPSLQTRSAQQYVQIARGWAKIEEQRSKTPDMGLRDALALLAKTKTKTKKKKTDQPQPEQHHAADQADEATPLPTALLVSRIQKLMRGKAGNRNVIQIATSERNIPAQIEIAYVREGETFTGKLTGKAMLVLPQQTP